MRYKDLEAVWRPSRGLRQKIKIWSPEFFFEGMLSNLDNSEDEDDDLNDDDNDVKEDDGENVVRADVETTKTEGKTVAGVGENDVKVTDAKISENEVAHFKVKR